MKNIRKIAISYRSTDIESQKIDEKSVISRPGASFVTPQRHALFGIWYFRVDAKVLVFGILVFGIFGGRKYFGIWYLGIWYFLVDANTKPF